MEDTPNTTTKAPPVPGPGEVLTLEEVAKADFSGVTPLGVLGFPIKHSVSPQMHNAALAVLAKTDPKFANWRYYRIEVPPERLKEALDLLAARGFVGLNLTIPHKVEVIPLLKGGRCDDAIVNGAVNTLLCRSGEWEGYNTDGFGFRHAVDARWLSFPSGSKNAILIGAGGAARAVGMSLLIDGYRLCVGNRTKDRLDGLIAGFRTWHPNAQIIGFDLAKPPVRDLPKAPLVVNVTSLGLKPDDPSPVDLSLFGPGTRVFDTTYGRHKSALLQQADALGFPASNGLPMLVHQGALSLHYWTNFPKSLLDDVLDAMFAAAYAATGVPDPRRNK